MSFLLLMNLIQYASFEDGLKLVKLRGEAMQVLCKLSDSFPKFVSFPCMILQVVLNNDISFHRPQGSC